MHPAHVAERAAGAPEAGGAVVAGIEGEIKKVERDCFGIRGFAGSICKVVAAITITIFSCKATATQMHLGAQVQASTLDRTLR